MDEKRICYNCFCELSEMEGACPNCGYDPAWGKEKYPLALPHGHILCDKYILGRVLGQGGYGITYLAMDKWLGAKVAVKEYFPEIGATRTSNTCYVTASSIKKQEEYEKGKADFLQEARVLAAFSENPNIVKIHGYFEENGTAYFAMDYVEGISFQKYIGNQGGKIPWKDAYEKLLPIIASLEEVHKKEIIHRDISPDNIYITTDGVMKLLDFGAARYQSLNQSHSLDVVVKHGYAPFEQYKRRSKQGPYTDVYALCACFYAAVTGVLPPDAPERIEDDKIEHFSTIGIEVPQAVADVIFKGLEVKSENRYQNMTELREALIQAVEFDSSVVMDTDIKLNTEETVLPLNPDGTDDISDEDSQAHEEIPDNNEDGTVISHTENAVDEIVEQEENLTILTRIKAIPTKTKRMAAIICGVVIALGFGIFWFAHPHKYSEWTIVENVTCIADGLQERECFCGDKQTETIKALGHNTIIDAAINPTCEVSGLTEGNHCSNCGEVFVAQEEIPATGHTLNVLPAVAATCTEAGLTEGYGCVSCGYVEVVQTTIDPLGHTEVEDKAVAATCLAEGKTKGSHCSVCNEVLVAQESIPKTDHKVVTDSAVSPTCTSNGLTEGSHCSVCGKTIKAQDTISASGHEFYRNKCRQCGTAKWWAEVSSDQSMYFLSESDTIEIDITIYTNESGATTSPYYELYLDGELWTDDSWSSSYGNGESLDITFYISGGAPGTYALYVYTDDGFTMGMCAFDIVWDY